MHCVVLRIETCPADADDLLATTPVVKSRLARELLLDTAVVVSSAGDAVISSLASASAGAGGERGFTALSIALAQVDAQWLPRARSWEAHSADLARAKPPPAKRPRSAALKAGSRAAATPAVPLSTWSMLVQLGSFDGLRILPRTPHLEVSLISTYAPKSASLTEVTAAV